MIISVIGECDKLPIMISLLKLCQFFGDVITITSDEDLSSISEDIETYVDYKVGYIEDIMFVLTDSTPDEARQEVGYTHDDADFVIYDNKLDTSGDIIVYVKSGEMTEWEHDMLEYLDPTDYTTININTGKKALKLTDKMYNKSVELLENREILDVDKSITLRLINILGPELNIPVNTIKKAVLT